MSATRFVATGGRTRHPALVVYGWVVALEATGIVGLVFPQLRTTNGRSFELGP